ncbi:hypothetical protein Moror_14264 [Moniliophthora roreri MCA 2997]|uniref:DUF6533 domain-containing protein n=2 Tax=Moniliophthora roreri TaxID=221103 RepID=V2XQA3_MONRO|nr:hypothetical protein Moror_14264 [Moniliophthora roreri MCA 2997]
MSSTIQSLANFFQCDAFHLAAITILYWDHLLTLKTEVKCLWKRPSNLSSYLFFLNRYFNAVAVAIAMTSNFRPDSSWSCIQLSRFREAVLIVAQLIVVVILTLRIYALYACSRRLLYFMLSVIAVLLAIVVFFTYNSPGGEFGTSSGRCTSQFDLSASIRKAVAWEMLLVYDVLLFGLALHNAFKTRRDLKLLRMLKNRVSLKVILLRDGAMYFGVMMLTNLVNILTYYTAEGCMRGGLAAFASSLSVTLTSRLMLNLHEVMDTGIYLSQFTSQVDEQSNASIVFYERRPTPEESFDV